jgi:hypothetical protein
MKKNILIIILILHLVVPSFAFSDSVLDVSSCQKDGKRTSYTLLCKDVDDIICKNIPDNLRRSCDESTHNIINPQMNSSDVYQFAKGCFKSGVETSIDFFTEFLPSLCKAIWEIGQESYKAITNENLVETIKGRYESGLSIASDAYEMIQENPGVLFDNLWEKIVDTVGPLIANYDCLNPQSKVEKICSVIAEWTMPPAILARVIVKGPLAIKELITLKLISEKKLQQATLITKMSSSKIITTDLESSLELKAYKKSYEKNLELKEGTNNDFIKKSAEDSLNAMANTLYFDVENSVQKVLNDSILIDKTAVDAVNNSFFEKLYVNIRKNKDLTSRLDGEYKDYKSYRFRLKLMSGEDRKKYESLFDEVYKKTNDEFSKDLERQGISKKIPPRNDGLNNTNTWFLSGSGDNSLQANMAARAARNQRKNTTLFEGSLSLYKDQINDLFHEVNDIEQVRQKLAKNSSLIDSDVLEKTISGKVIPSKQMINILRKTKPAEFQSEEYLSKVKSKILEKFGTKVDDETIIDFTNYFKKVDGISPPVFLEERVVIDLNQAKENIISVDFSGIGVENIYQQMKELSEQKIAKEAPEKSLNFSFKKMQDGMNIVTGNMNNSKQLFREAISNVEGKQKGNPLFSGDDGIYMPAHKDWHLKDKLKFIKTFSNSSDPSKYRITFVSSRYSNGKIIPAEERSKRVVRAETIEKNIRLKIVGVDKIPDKTASNLITAIDFLPDEKGGVFNLIIGGKKYLDQNQIDLLKKSFENSLNKVDGERIGQIIFEEN